MDIGKFCSDLSADMGSFLRQIVNIEVNGGEVPIRILQVPSNPSKPFPLVVTFHGARPENGPYPMFYGNEFAGERSDKLLIAMADPSLANSTDLRFGWFCGDQNFNVPDAISEILNEMSARLTISRMIFFGGSIGAHPALRYAKQFADSVAILINPVTEISAYYDFAVSKYFEVCWPGQFDAVSFKSDWVLDDAASVFEGGTLDSTVVIVQNSTDPHLLKQAVPLITSLGRCANAASRLLTFVSFYPDAIGHRMTVPEMIRCVDAAVNAEDTAPISIARMREALSMVSERSDVAPRMNDRDIVLANTLATQAAR